MSHNDDSHALGRLLPWREAGTSSNMRISKAELTLLLHEHPELTLEFIEKLNKIREDMLITAGVFEEEEEPEVILGNKRKKVKLIKNK